MGATLPKLIFMNNKYLGVLNYNGLLIYDRNQGRLNSAIDIKALGFNVIQGDGAMESLADDDYLLLKKRGENKGYVYSFEYNELSKIEDISTINLNSDIYASSEEISSIRGKLKEENKELSIIKHRDSFGILLVDLNNLKNSKIFQLDKNYEVVTEFEVGK